MTKSEFKNAFRDAVSDEYAQETAPYEAVCVPFSREFLQKMDRLIEQDRNPFWHLSNTVPKRILLVLTFLVILLCAAETVPAVRAYTNDFLRTVFSDHIQLNWEPGNDAEITGWFMITELPDNYLESCRHESAFTSHVEYTDPVGNILSLDQSMSSVYLSVNSDSEQTEERTIPFNAGTALLYSSDNTGFRALLWREEDHSLSLTCRGSISEEDFLRIASSVKKADR